MKHLTQYVARHNSWQSALGQPTMSFPLSQSNINLLADDIDCQLSPENLHCDGEITLAQAQEKRQYLNRVMTELEQYAERNTMTIPQAWERW